MPMIINLFKLNKSASLPYITDPIPKKTMKMVIIQLTPEGLKLNCAEIVGVETLNTVSFRTAKNIR